MLKENQSLMNFLHKNSNRHDFQPATDHHQHLITDWLFANQSSIESQVGYQNSKAESLVTLNEPIVNIDIKGKTILTKIKLLKNF